MTEFVFDQDRKSRLGFGETIFCQYKTLDQIEEIIRAVDRTPDPVLFTRLEDAKYGSLDGPLQSKLHYDPASQTGYLGQLTAKPATGSVVIISAGTSDTRPALEARATLRFHGIDAPHFGDIGVAGLWRLQSRLDEISDYPVVITVAGMDAALPTVLGGLIGNCIIAVPTSVGYGAARAGETALMSILTSCAPGIVTTNIDNGYGAAMAALRITRSFGVTK